LCRPVDSQGGSASSSRDAFLPAAVRRARRAASSDQWSDERISSIHSKVSRVRLSVGNPTTGFWPTIAMKPMNVTTLAALACQPTRKARLASIVTT
jgi:hypothetical protein